LKGNARITVSPKVWTPKQIEEAWELKQKLGTNAMYISGGTWVQLRWELGEAVPNHIIHLGRIEDLPKVKMSSDHTLNISAFASLAACRSSPDIHRYWPILAEAARNVGSPAVRNQGTIGGNIACGYGDLIPALLVLDAKITSFDGKQYITDELINFLNQNPSDKIVTEIHLQKSSNFSNKTFYKKIGRREAFTLSLLTVAGALLVNDKNEVEQARLAVGGGDMVPKRLLICEGQLKGKVLTEELCQRAHAQILQEFQPHTDRYTSSQYRKLIAANLLIAGLTDSLY
jgi:carbon-monoxide dehydrogenase medium subunit